MSGEGRFTESPFLSSLPVLHLGRNAGRPR
jgi:hypothetical protein